MSFSICGYFLSLLILLEASPSAFLHLGYKFYIIFIVALTFFIVPTFLYFPETKGIPLEQIGRLFDDEIADVDLYRPKGTDDHEMLGFDSEKCQVGVRHEESAK